MLFCGKMAVTQFPRMSLVEQSSNMDSRNVLLRLYIALHKCGNIEAYLH